MGVNTDYRTIESGGLHGLYDAAGPGLSPGFDSQIAPASGDNFLGGSTGDSNDYFVRTGYDYGAAVRANVLANRAFSPDDLAEVPGIDRVSREFKQKVIDIAARLDVNPNVLMAIMSFESGLDHTIVNPRSNATGLIQFLPSTARNLGTSVEALKSMTPERQLDYVEKYFAPFKGRLETVEDAYMAVLWPRGVGKERDYVLFSRNDADPNIRAAYTGNRELDANRDGSVTKAEAAAPVLRRLNIAPPPAGQPNDNPPLEKPAVDTRYRSPNFSERNGTDIDTIILHHTIGDLNSSIGELTRTKPDPNGRSRVSAHYVIDKDGTIYQLVNDEKVAWHAGNVNSRSIGIEIVNRGDGRDSYTEAQYRALEQLVPHLAQKYDVPMNRLLGHSDVDARGPEPSSNFDWGRVRRAVERADDAAPEADTPVPPRPPQSDGNGGGTYRVRAGDTLSGIAARHNTTWQELARINGINNPNLIHPGDVLRLPGGNQTGNPPNDNATPRTYRVRAGDTLSEIAARHDTTVGELARLNNIRNPDFILAGTTLRLPSGGANGQTPRAFNGSYTVRRGDTLSEIAARHDTTWQELARANDIRNPNLIYPGTTLRVPGDNRPATAPNDDATGRTYTVRAGDTLSEIAARERTTVREIARLNNISNPDLISVGQRLQLPARNGATAPPERPRTEPPVDRGGSTPSGMPVDGRFTSEFGSRIHPRTGRRSFHTGIDIAANTGTRVSSTAAGRVEHVGYDADGYGNYIIVNHGDAYRTLYAHLSRVNVRNGDPVSDNQKIGEVGSTGNSTGPHLHYEVRRNGEAVNPRPFL